KRVFLVILFTSFSGSLVSRIPGAVQTDNDGSIIVDEDDNPVMVMEDIIERVEITPAGSRWGVRPDLLFYIEAAWQRREIERIKARLDLIEGKH
ncbi:hypothetical protein R9K77_00010, partial [Escherichia coli]